ncbi:hypothetical protein [Polluticoccus soli]|uniref:hypothetical protein n=1 Tax=Polluticoccus soli TaxID=3034150 RepID=UPI0023E29F53|nr:hypothetical protein [Flavipsychrobacter sp. JY13-12]
MKTITLSLVAILFGSSIQAQPYAFNDAVALRKLVVGKTFTPASLKIADTILSKYLDVNAGEDVRVDFYQENDLFIPLLPAGSAFAGLSGIPAVGAGNPFSSIGGLDVTTLADGIARFLVKRTKEELSVAFFDKFRKEMSKEKYRDAVTLFPETCDMLGDIGDNIYMYQAFLPALQEAFQQDLRMLTNNLPKVITDGNYAAFFNRHPLLKYTCLSGNYVTNGILNEVHPGKIIEGFPVEYIDSMAKEQYASYDTFATKNISATLKLFQLVSTSFKAQNNSDYWVPADSVKKAFSDPLTVRIYLSLIAEQAEDIEFVRIDGNERSVATILKKLAAAYNANYPEYAAFCTQLVAKGETVHGYILEAEKITREKQTPPFELYYNYFNGVVDLIEQAGRFTELPFMEKKGMGRFDTTFANYIRICRRTSDLALNIKERNYSTAAVDAYTIYNFAFSKPVIEKDQELKLLGAEEDRIMNAQRFSPVLLRLGTFMASVAEAKSSEEVSDAIEAAALPAGSSRVKRESRGNIALNAYLGPFVGYERIEGIDDQFQFNSYGLLAPVGVSASLGQFYSVFSGKHTSSLSLFLSAIDLGAVAAFRMEDDETSQIPTITLRELVAPGAFLIYGFGKTPISFGAGWQIGPRLRNVTATDNTVSEMYSRFSLSFTVDIPLLNFATWPGNRQ